jgi:hypothetical protein
MTNEERMLAWQAKEKQNIYRKENAKATDLKTNIGDETLGAGQSSLVKRKKMLDEINALQKSGSLMRSDKGFYITDKSKQGLLNDAVFKNTLGSVKNYNDGLARQMAEQKALEQQEQKEQKLRNEADPDGVGTSTEQEDAIAEQAVKQPPVGSFGEQIWDHIKSQDARTQTRYGLLGMDAASTAISWLPVGNLVSAGMGLVSTLGNAALDFTDENVDASDAWKNLAVGVALDGASIFGGKGMKAMNSIGNMKPLIKGILPILKTGLAAYGGMAGMESIKGMTQGEHSKWQDILNRDLSTWDSADYMEAFAAARFLMGAARTAGRKTVGGLRGKKRGPSVYDRADTRAGNIAEHAVARVTGGVSGLDIQHGQKMAKKAGIDFENNNKLVAKNEAINRARKKINENQAKKYKQAEADYELTKDMSPEKLASLDKKVNFQNNRVAHAQAKQQESNAAGEQRINRAKAVIDRSKARLDRDSDAYSAATQQAAASKAAWEQAGKPEGGLFKSAMDADAATVVSKKAIHDKSKQVYDERAQKGINIGTKINDRKVKYEKLVKKRAAKAKQAKDLKDKYVNTKPEDIEANKKKYEKAEKLQKKSKERLEKSNKDLEEALNKKAVSQSNKNKTEDDLARAKLDRKGVNPKGTVDKLEREHEQLVQTSKENERNLKQSQKEAQKAYDILDDTDKKAKANAKKHLDEVNDKISKSAKSYTKAINESQAKLDKEKSSWRRHDRGLRKGAGAVYNTVIGGAGDLIGDLSITGSDFRHVTMAERAKSEKKRLAKKNGKQSKSQIAQDLKKAKEYEKKKRAEAKKKKEKKAMGGKLIARPTFRKGGRLIQKFQDGNIIDELLKGTTAKELTPEERKKLNDIRDNKNNKSKNNTSEKQIERTNDWKFSKEEHARLIKELSTALRGETNYGQLNAVLEKMEQMTPQELNSFNEQYKSDSIQYFGTNSGETAEEAIRDDVEGFFGADDFLFGANDTDVTNLEKLDKLFGKGDKKVDVSDKALKKAEQSVYENVKPVAETTGTYLEDKGKKVNSITSEEEIKKEDEEEEQKSNTKKSDEEKNLEEKIQEKEAEEAIKLDETLEDVAQKNELAYTNYNDKDGYKAKGTGFGEIAGNVLSKVNMGDLYNIGQLFKKPQQFTANYTPAQAVTLSKRAVSNMPGYAEMKAEASKPTYNVKTNDLMAKQTLQKRNVNAKNEKLRKLNSANAQFIEQQEAKNAQIGNRNRLNRQQVNNQNAQMRNQRNMQAAQLDAQAAAQRDKQRAQTIGSIGIRLNQGTEEALAARAGNKYRDQLGIMNNYNSYTNNRLRETQLARDKEKATLTTEYNDLVKAGKLDPTISTLDTYLEKNTNAGADWNKSDDELKRLWDTDYTNKFGVDVNSSEFGSNTDRLKQDYLNRRERIRLDPKNA